MPLTVVDTNIPRESLPETFGNELFDLVCKITGKPTAVVCLDINPGKLMIRDGNTDPCVHICFHSFTQALFTKEATGRFVTEVTSFIHEKLGVDNKRISFTFHPMASGHLVGLNGQLMG
ncbi:macrophage migration inhibitory factor-like [Amphiura filiformis]|uniref:macrophage migration inhibitory factor-like n=1 Tax=Amphiura filiformis TaxID=82378 RepID=UPI003B2270CF